MINVLILTRKKFMTKDFFITNRKLSKLFCKKIPIFVNEHHETAKWIGTMQMSSTLTALFQDGCSVSGHRCPPFTHSLLLQCLTLQPVLGEKSRLTEISGTWTLAADGRDLQVISTTWHVKLSQLFYDRNFATGCVYQVENWTNFPHLPSRNNLKVCFITSDSIPLDWL